MGAGVDEKKNVTTTTNNAEMGGVLSGDEIVAVVSHGEALNAAGFRDQLRRQYGLVGLVGIALTIDNAWGALGSSLSVSIRKYGRSLSVSSISRLAQQPTELPSLWS